MLAHDAAYEIGATDNEARSPWGRTRWETRARDNQGRELADLEREAG